MFTSFKNIEIPITFLFFCAAIYGKISNEKRSFSSMTKSANDVRIRKQKDTINQLNKTIDNLNRTIGVLNRQLSDNEQLMAERKAEMALLRKNRACR